MEQLAWHAMRGADVTDHLQVDPACGIAEAEAAARLKSYGRNRPGVRPTRSVLVRFGSQLLQPLVLVLIAAGAVTAGLGEILDAGVIFGVVLINAMIGFLQEGKAETALIALARTVASEATVLRAGIRRRLDAEELVPGDLVILSAGDKVPADIRLLRCKELRTAEGTLTGESVPVDKRHEPLSLDTPLAERADMAYCGTLVVGGQGMGVVVATGDATETGRISRLISLAPDMSTPLTRKIESFARRLLVLILTLAGLTFAIGILRGESPFDMFMAAVALAVGAIPEGLPAAITVTMAIGVARMAKRQAIIRRLPAVETLGSTTVICSDKTGTLTENAMTVCAVWAGRREFSVTGSSYDPAGRIETGGDAATIAGALRETLVAGALCNDARLIHEDRQWKIIGDPTEGALLVVARKAGLDERWLASNFPRLDELSFDSIRRYMATLHRSGGGLTLYVKGAVEKLLPRCLAMLDEAGHETALDASAAQAAAGRMADSGLRVLALARSASAPDGQLDPHCIERGLVLFGLVGMIDPPRPRAITAIGACNAAGIRVKMITGDHPGTAIAVARQLGIIEDGAVVKSGRDLARLEEREWQRVATDVDVFARVEPEQKLRLVSALQANGEIVAMTGDGVNDAPALKQADIGVAMGEGGTDVAKEAAAMVLTDNNFATIEAAIEEGRSIYDNLVKFIAWTIPTNGGEGLVLLAAIVAGTTLPVAPLQILWINMTTAVLLGMALAFEPAEPGVMQRPPRPPGAPVLDRVLVLRSGLISLFLLGGAFGLFEWALRRGHSVAEAQTISANVFVMVEVLYLFNCRSLTRPPWSCAFNVWIWLGSATMLALQLAFTYAPLLNRTFQTAPIAFTEWALIIAVAAACAAVVEAEKWWRMRHHNWPVGGQPDPGA